MLDGIRGVLFGCVSELSGLLIVRYVRAGLLVHVLNVDVKLLL